VFVSLAHDGRLRIDRGYVRPEDEPAAEGDDATVAAEGAKQASGPAISVGGQVQDEPAADDEDDAIRPLPDRLVSELTAVRTVALRDALAGFTAGGLHRSAARAHPVGVPLARAPMAACRSA
jgi:ParB family chromosome partitioning protein